MAFARFGGTAGFRAAKQIGRACLLLPGTPEETKQATDLIDPALADAKTRSETWVQPYFMFTKGLAEHAALNPSSRPCPDRTAETFGGAMSI